jgi:hypothetical protein
VGTHTDRRGGIELYSSLLGLGQGVSVIYKYTTREERGAGRGKEKGFSSHGDVKQLRLTWNRNKMESR